jgi:hypothetical protein
MRPSNSNPGTFYRLLCVLWIKHDSTSSDACSSPFQLFALVSLMINLEGVIDGNCHRSVLRRRLFCKFTSFKRCLVLHVLHIEVNNCRWNSCAPLGNLGCAHGGFGGKIDGFFITQMLVYFFCSFSFWRIDVDVVDNVLCTRIVWTWCAYLKIIEYAIKKVYTERTQTLGEKGLLTPRCWSQNLMNREKCWAKHESDFFVNNDGRRWSISISNKSCIDGRILFPSLLVRFGHIAYNGKALV